ncbi:MAG: hypothetical protein GY716_16595 [bacterium]|nr:hypothetical protein [bacterium]
MKKILAFIALAALACFAGAQAEQKSLASTLEIYAFPGKGQAPEQQSQDEAECYQWAVKQSGSDPFDLAKDADKAKEETAQKKSGVDGSSQGAGARGAVGGAAAGALIGEIVSDDPGGGAAYGAAAGMIRGRRRAKQREQAQKQSIEQQGQQKQQQIDGNLDNFKKAFSVCLESKNYLVKY